MLERRTMLGAVLTAAAGLFVWPFASKSTGTVTVEEQADGWRIIKYKEGKTWFDIRFRLDHDDPPAFGLQQAAPDGSRCDIDWSRLAQAAESSC